LDDRDLKRVEAHLKRTFGNPHVALKGRSKQRDSADVELKGESIGVVCEDEDEAGSFLFEMTILADDFKQAEARLKDTFGNPHVALKARPKQKDSAEVEVNGEFIGVVYEDEDEADSFLFEMAILAEDLD
jgi:hypothetical protein